MDDNTQNQQPQIPPSMPPPAQPNVLAAPPGINMWKPSRGHKVKRVVEAITLVVLAAIQVCLILAFAGFLWGLFCKIWGAASNFGYSAVSGSGGKTILLIDLAVAVAVAGAATWFVWRR